MKIPIFPGKYHQNGGFSMAMLVYRRVPKKPSQRVFGRLGKMQNAKGSPQKVTHTKNSMKFTLT